MASAAEAARTGRRRVGSEAEPSEVQPEDEAPVGEAEAEPSVTEGVYFSKVPARDVWHAHDESHDHIGTVYRAGEKWQVKAGRRDMPATFGSAASGRAFLSGYHLGKADGQDQAPIGRVERIETDGSVLIRMPNGVLRVYLPPNNTQGEPTALRAAREAAQAPTAGKDASTNASHDADA